MVVASNTSPISNLAIIGHLDLLQKQFGTILIPPAVKTELERITIPGARASIEQAILSGWLKVQRLGNARVAAILANDLDHGEAEVIALAFDINADCVLIDEKEGRIVARQAGLPVMGVLGILLRAKASGEIQSVRATIAALREKARFFVAQDLEADVLRDAGEWA